MAKAKRQNLEFSLSDLPTLFPNIKLKSKKTPDGKVYICGADLPKDDGFIFIGHVFTSHGELTKICFKKGSKTYTFCK